MSQQTWRLKAVKNANDLDQDRILDEMIELSERLDTLQTARHGGPSASIPCPPKMPPPAPPPAPGNVLVNESSQRPRPKP